MYLQPLKVKTEQKIGNAMTEDVADEDEAMNSRCDVINAVTEIDMIQDAETKGNMKSSIEHDQIVIKRLLNKEQPNQG